MTHNPSSASKLLVPESRTSNFANLSCILVPYLSGTGNLDRLEHALLLTSFWYEILVPLNCMQKLGSCDISLIVGIYLLIYLSPKNRQKMS